MKWNPHLYKDSHSYVSEYGKALLKYVNNGPGRKILDLGCGTGILTNELAKGGADVLGIDLSEEMISAAKKNYPFIKFEIADILNLPYENTFDTVFSNAVLHWIKNAGLALQNINKVLKSTGSLVCEFGAHNNVAAITSAFKNAMQSRGYEYNDPFFLPAAGEYRALLEKNGFNAELVDEYDRPTPLKEGKDGIKNFIEQFFSASLEKVAKEDKEKIFSETQAKAGEKLWNGERWIADYRRIRVIAKKK